MDACMYVRAGETGEGRLRSDKRVRQKQSESKVFRLEFGYLERP